MAEAVGICPTLNQRHERKASGILFSCVKLYVPLTRPLDTRPLDTPEGFNRVARFWHQNFFFNGRFWHQKLFVDGCFLYRNFFINGRKMSGKPLGKAIRLNAIGKAMKTDCSENSNLSA
jgi:hypothetical protein